VTSSSIASTAGVSWVALTLNAPPSNIELAGPHLIEGTASGEGNDAGGLEVADVDEPLLGPVEGEDLGQAFAALEYVTSPATILCVLIVSVSAMPPFSALGVEAFVNEVGEMAGRGANLPVSGVAAIDQLRDLSATLTEIEASKGPVQLKYQITSKILSGRTFDKGAQPFQDFADLMRLRDDLVHLRHRDRTDADGYISPSSAVARMLQQKGLTYSPGGGPTDLPGGMSWLNEIETAGVATWAYRAARSIVFGVGEMLPDDFRAHGIQMMKWQISNLPAIVE
jgi:hypothetical protein